MKREWTNGQRKKENVKRIVHMSKYIDLAKKQKGELKQMVYLTWEKKRTELDG